MGLYAVLSYLALFLNGEAIRYSPLFIGYFEDPGVALLYEVLILLTNDVLIFMTAALSGDTGSGVCKILTLDPVNF